MTAADAENIIKELKKKASTARLAVILLHAQGDPRAPGGSVHHHNFGELAAQDRRSRGHGRRDVTYAV
jgi:hypothetical protein